MNHFIPTLAYCKRFAIFLKNFWRIVQGIEKKENFSELLNCLARRFSETNVYFYLAERF